MVNTADLQDEVTQIEGLVAEIIFRNEENGYTVCTLADSDDTTAVGLLPYLHPGESVRLTGKWTNHPDYGRQFKVSHYEPITPRSSQAIIHYLSSGLIKGIGAKTAEKLVQRFGDKTLDILQQQPDKAARIKGISTEKARDFARQLRDRQVYQELMLLLAPHGIGLGTVLRIYRQYGNESVYKIRDNPYQLADEVYGIGFLTADRLALELGIDASSPARLSGALRHTLVQALNQGHTCLPEEQWLRQAGQLVEKQITMDHPAVRQLIAESNIVLTGKHFGHDTDDLISLPLVNAAEQKSAEKLALLLEAQPRCLSDLCHPAAATAAIKKISARQKIILAPEQEAALNLALRKPVTILTGGPGTGKTTIIRLLCDCFVQRSGRVLLAAPTGRAARRMSETSGYEAKTLHRLLEISYMPDDEKRREDREMASSVQLDCDLLIVDEASMIDCFLLRSLLKSIVPGTRLVMVGDSDQLPSVGPGQVLRDLIETNLIPVARLKKIYRQSAQSLIIQNAHRINDGLWPILDQSFDSQFLLVLKEDVTEMAEAVVRLCSDILPNQYRVDPLREVQVLTPTRKGPAGSTALNQKLQEVLRPGCLQDQETDISAHGCRFGSGDKVMQIRNNYEIEWHINGDASASAMSRGSGIFNGETGTIISIDKDEFCLEVMFDDDRQAIYDRTNIEDLDLAYAMTIHKSQGSEYPIVVLVIPPGAPQLLTRNLLYTAVTRARRKIVLITSRRVLGGMLANNQALQRFTQLGKWLLIYRNL